MSGQIVLVFYGKAEPAGSKRAVPAGGKHNKSGRWLVVDANKKAKPYKDRLAAEAREQYQGPVLTGALAVEMIFFEPRPKAHYGSGRNEAVLRDGAPAFPAVKPDALKLARGVEDALTGVIWSDDCLTCDLIARKRYVERSEPARVEVRVATHVVQTVGDMVAHGLLEPPRPREVPTEQMTLSF